MLPFKKLGGYITAKLARKNVVLADGVYTLSAEDLDPVIKLVQNRDQLTKMMANHAELVGDIKAFASMLKAFGINAGFTAQVTGNVIQRIYNPELCLFDTTARAKFSERFKEVAPDTNLCMCVGQVVVPLVFHEDEDEDFPTFRSAKLDGLTQFEGELALFTYPNKAVVVSVKCGGWDEDPGMLKKVKGLKFVARVKNIREKDAKSGALKDKHPAASIITTLNGGDQAMVEKVLAGPQFGGAYVQPIENCPFGIYSLRGYIQENRTSEAKGTSWIGDVIRTIDDSGKEVLLRIPSSFADSYGSVMMSVVPYTDPSGVTYEPDTDEDTALFTGPRSIVFYGVTVREKDGKTYRNPILAMIEPDEEHEFIPMPEGSVYDPKSGTFLMPGAATKVSKTKPSAPEAEEEDFMEDLTPSDEADIEDDSDDIGLGEEEAFADKMAQTVSGGGVAVAEAPPVAAKKKKAAPAPVEEPAGDEEEDDFDLM